jgi:hypothetical protein
MQIKAAGHQQGAATKQDQKQQQEAAGAGSQAPLPLQHLAAKIPDRSPIAAYGRDRPLEAPLADLIPDSFGVGQQL